MAALGCGRSLTEHAAEALRTRIVHGSLQFGEPFSEIALAAELGVSKTPVREALMQLQRDGLVQIHTRRGTFVFTMTAEQVRELWASRDPRVGGAPAGDEPAIARRSSPPGPTSSGG